MNASPIFLLSPKKQIFTGERTKANTPKGSFDNFCRIGRAYAAVLPVPVLAVPKQRKGKKGNEGIVKNVIFVSKKLNYLITPFTHNISSLQSWRYR